MYIPIGNRTKFYSLREICIKLKENLTMPTALGISMFFVFFLRFYLLKYLEKTLLKVLKINLVPMVRVSSSFNALMFEIRV